MRACCFKRWRDPTSSVERCAEEFGRRVAVILPSGENSDKLPKIKESEKSLVTCPCENSNQREASVALTLLFDVSTCFDFLYLSMFNLVQPPNSSL